MNASESDLAETLGPAQADPAELPDRGGKLDRLTGLATHDAERWGAPWTDEYNRRQVDRLADLVRLVGARTGLPPKRSSAAVLEGIAGSAVPALFVFMPGDLARPVTDADIWRPRFASGAEQWEAWLQDLKDGLFSAGPSLFSDEAAWRGINVADDPYLCIDRDAPELPELRGVAGALEMLRIFWAQRALNSASLDDGRAAELAMLRVDAVRLFEFLDSIRPGVDAARPAPGPVDAKVVAVRPALPPYTPDGNRSLFEEWEAAGGEKGGTACLAAKYGKTARAIQKRISDCRDQFESADKISKRRAKGKTGQLSRGEKLVTKWPGTVTKVVGAR